MRKIFISLMMALLAFGSCSTDELSSGGNGSQKGKVQLVLSTDGFDEVESRAVDESVIHDINILEYKKGALVKQVYLDKDDGVDFGKAVEVSGLEDLDATLLDNKASDTEDNAAKNGIENFIFVVANYGKQIGSDQVSPLATLEDFKMEFTGKKDLSYLPMTGFYYGGINASSTTQMNVTLQRAVAKVSFTLDTSSFKVGGSTPSQLVVNSIKLCNVPGNITLYPCEDRPSLPKNGETVEWNSENGHTPFPTASEMASSLTYGDDENQSSDANTYVAYIPENVRGSYSNITDNKNKRPSKCDANITDDSKDKSYTYILVDLNYATSDGTAKNATYKIYLGGNSTGDMNLLRNTQYNVTTSLYGAGANDKDTRITVKDITPVDVVETVNANCYMIDMSDMPNVGSRKVVIPLQQVINGWDYIATNSSSSITASDVQKILEDGNWEIQTEWRTWKGSNITGTKSSDFSASNLKATLTISADVKNGNNAVVKLVSKVDGKTYWSWHLWFTDYKPSATDGTAENGQVHQYFGNAFLSGGIYVNKYMMDRNLGATITGVSDAISQPSTRENAIKYYGLLYQWGRKDPFIGSNGKNQNSSTYSDFVEIYDGTTNESPSKGSTPFKTASATTCTSIAYSVYNPSTFFYGNDKNNNNWLSSYSSSQDALWSGNTSNAAKSVFDPCPPGWRVPLGGDTPTNNPWSGFGNNDKTSIGSGNGSTYFGWKNAISGQTGTAGRLYSYNSRQSWYPASGCLYFSNGTLYDVGNFGYYWSATSNSSNGLNGFGFGFGGASGVYPSFYYNRANGFRVRCVQE